MNKPKTTVWLNEASHITNTQFKTLHDRYKNTYSTKIFETVSFHIVKPCNMKCRYCYATFEDVHTGPQMSLNDAQTVVRMLAEAGMQKITFAGGEPLLYKHLKEIIIYAKKINLTTSIISNGSLLTTEWLREMRPYLDWVGISVDSLNPSTNAHIGRTTNPKETLSQILYSIKSLGYKLKINTVVNRYNWQEDMGPFIREVNPSRWKVFQVLKVEGQNDDHYRDMAVSPEQFSRFLGRHSSLKALVPEDNEAMTGSYLLVDPIGRLFENSSGKHTYSEPLMYSSVSDCLKQIKLDRSMFIKRGGIYRW